MLWFLFMPPGPFIPPGFAVPLWERGRRAGAVGLLLWLRLLLALTRYCDLPSLEGLGVCFSPLSSYPRPFFIPPAPSYPPASPYPFGKGDGRAGAVGLLLWLRLLLAQTRYCDLPSLEGLGGCLSFFFHTPALFSYPRPLLFHTPRLRRTPLGKGTEGWRGWSLALFHTHFSSSYPPASPDPFEKGMGGMGRGILAFVVFCGGIFNYWRELFIFADWPGWPGFDLTDLK